MKKLFLFLPLTVILVLSLKGQSDGDTAQKILDRASSKLKASKGINANFSVEQKDKNNHSQGSTKGIVKIKGNKYYVQESDNQVFCDGVQIWNFDGQNEVTVTRAENADADDFSPQKILSGFNKADFNFKLVSSSGANYEVQLMPVDKRKNFKQIKIFVNKSTSLITKAVVIDKSDNAIEIVFSNVNLNASIPDSQFSFDTSKHPGVEVINQ